MAVQQILLHTPETSHPLLGHASKGSERTAGFRKSRSNFRYHDLLSSELNGHGWQALCYSSSEISGSVEPSAIFHGRDIPGECSTSRKGDASRKARHGAQHSRGWNRLSAEVPSTACRLRCSDMDSLSWVNPVMYSRRRSSSRLLSSRHPLAPHTQATRALDWRICSSHTGYAHESHKRGCPSQAMNGMRISYDLQCDRGLAWQGFSAHEFHSVQEVPGALGSSGLLRGSGARSGRCIRVSVATYSEFSAGRQARVDKEQATQKKKEVQRELLAQTRKRKEIEKLQKEQVALYDSADPSAKPVWPFWRKKRSDEEVEARQLTKRIVSLGKRKQLDQIFGVLAQAKKDGVRVNLITVNAALAACVNCGDVDKAMAVFEAMVRPGGVGADSITYGTLLKGLGQAKRLDEAFELIEAMEDGTAPGMPKLTEVHINTLVNACAEAGEALRARGVLSRYRNFGQGGGFSIFTYNLLIKGYARSDNPLEALKVMEEMRLVGLPLQRVTYNSLILASVRGADLETALDLLEEMKSEAQRLNTSVLLPDVVTYTTLLKGLAEEGDLEGIRQMVREMKTLPTCVIDRVAYTAIIDACIAAGSAEDGVRFMAEMEAEAKIDSQLRPRAHVFLALMRALAERADVARTLELAQRMIPDAAGHVWPEDRAEADELVMEAALNAGNLRLARERLATIMKVQKGKPSLTPRGTQALVRLMAASNFSYKGFQPILFREEVSPRSAVETLMVRLEEIQPLRPQQTVAEVATRFLKENALPVCDSNERCVGVLYTRDCRKLGDQVGDIMQPPPPRIPHKALISQAVDALMKEKVEFLVVVKGRRGFEMSKGGFRQGIINDYYVEEADEEVLGFIGVKQLFNLKGDSLYLNGSSPVS